MAYEAANAAADPGAVVRRVKEARRCGVGGECGGRERWRQAQKEEADHLLEIKAYYGAFKARD